MERYAESARFAVRAWRLSGFTCPKVILVTALRQPSPAGGRRRAHQEIPAVVKDVSAGGHASLFRGGVCPGASLVVVALSATLAASSSPVSRRHHAPVRVTSWSPAGLVVETCSASPTRTGIGPDSAAAVEAMRHCVSHLVTTHRWPCFMEKFTTQRFFLNTYLTQPRRVLWNSVAMTNWWY